MTPQSQYDYIIAGTGCAGLSLAIQLIQSGQFADKKILLVDKEEKNNNDRTWCFWETEPGWYESLVYKRWDQVWFYSDRVSRLLQLSPYTYKLIRGIDFYNYCFSLIHQQKNIEIVTGTVKEMVSNEKETYIVVNDQKIGAQYIFNSILFKKPRLNKKKEYFLQQHFKGWIIETAEPVFEADKATLMDFRIDQAYGTSFVYVMPFSSTRALVEFTLFTDKLLEQEQYEEELKEYISRFLTIDAYTIEEKEYGVIPMTNYRFPPFQHHIINIGTAGGQTKASSGYTFKFIQKHSAAIVSQLINNRKPYVKPAPDRFRFYDSVLLRILHHKNFMGKTIFTDLFSKNKPQQVLRFLDNESSLAGELKIISSLPFIPFFNAAIHQLKPTDRDPVA